MDDHPHGSPAVFGFREAVAFIEQGLNYEKTDTWAYNKRWLNLHRVEALLAALGDPQRRYPAVHVAGTKGKGTTAGVAAHCLTHCGMRTGLLTSPHLVTQRERIRLDGAMIPEADFARIVGEFAPHVEMKRREQSAGSFRAPTYFEMLTALALRYFADREADWAVVEVGLGGRLDSTNIVRPGCCVITSIGFDHMDKLGDTVEEIAGEKAGIMKDGVPVVIGAQHYLAALETLRRHADERGCPRWEVGRELRLADASPLCADAADGPSPAGWRFTLSTPGGTYRNLTTRLLGAHQMENIAAAIGAVELAMDRMGRTARAEDIAAALAEFRMPGRLEVLQLAPAVVLDVAHTTESATALRAALETHFPGRPLHLVIACSKDKDPRGILAPFRGHCLSCTASQSKLPRAMPAEDVAAAAAQCDIAPPHEVRVIHDVWEALQDTLRRAQRTDLICVTGSFFTGGEIRARWRELHPELPE